MSYPPEATFQPQQIVCIERAELSLFAEVIQMVPERQRCWAKCLALGRWQADRNHWQLLHDLRDSPQLILPDNVFRAALDTEVMPVLTELWQREAAELALCDESKSLAEPALRAIDANLAGRQALQLFVQSLVLA
jgi:hypothetical protein